MAIQWDVQWDDEPAAPHASGVDTQFQNTVGGGGPTNVWNALRLQNMSPNEMVKHPYRAALQKTGTDALTPVAHFANQFLMDNPRKGMEAKGQEFLPPEEVGNPNNSAMRAISHLAGVAGAVKNPLYRFVAGRTAKGAGVAEGIASGAGLGALQGAEKPEDRLWNAGLGAATGGLVNGLARAPKNIHRATMGAADFEEKVQNAAGEAWQGADQRFGSDIIQMGLKNPQSKANLRTVFSDMAVAAPNSPALQAVIKESPLLKQMFDSPALAEKLTPREAQNVLNEFKARIPKQVLKGRNVDYADRPLLTAIDDMKDAMAKAFPEMNEARARIAAVRSNYDKVSSGLQNSAVENTLDNNFNSAIIRKAAKNLLKNNPDLSSENSKIWQEMADFRRTRRDLKPWYMLRNAGVTGAVLFGGKKAIDVSQGR